MKRTILGSMREGTRDAGAPPTQGATRVTPTLHVEEGALSFTLLVNPIKGNLGQNTQGALRVMRPSWMMACARRRRRIQVGTTHPACNYGHTHHDDSLPPLLINPTTITLAFSHKTLFTIPEN